MMFVLLQHYFILLYCRRAEDQQQHRISQNLLKISLHLTIFKEFENGQRILQSV
jgi:hypothetical protein